MGRSVGEPEGEWGNRRESEGTGGSVRERGGEWGHRRECEGTRGRVREQEGEWENGEQDGEWGNGEQEGERGNRRECEGMRGRAREQEGEWENGRDEVGGRDKVRKKWVRMNEETNLAGMWRVSSVNWWVRLSQPVGQQSSVWHS